MSKRPAFEEAIDRLYQLPLDQFVAARNTAAREAKGDEAATLRALQKPNVVAWGLNQLVWSARPVFDRLLAAAAALRTAQADALMRRPTDLRAATAEHREALRDAIMSTGQILERAGHAPTPDTVRALTAAFEALPWPEQPGRLVKPPAAPGFDVFAGIPLPPAGATPPTTKTGRRSGPAAVHVVPSRTEAPTGSAAPSRPTGSTARQDAQREREAKQAHEAERKAARARLEEARREAAAAAQRLRSSEARLRTLRDAERRVQEQLDAAHAALRDAEDRQREAAGAESRARTELRAAEETVARLQG